ncbi:putative aflatoxin biosynthesis ketoreductase nor-1 [Aspergillus ibericus CBS 121593]|uniref:Putative aflatoxin biosynthesis ketoreductase nor-1 n=1 Tax=Aspergillus ibericus CBS 121593 TaxID=1448316 RepID=A0A395GYK9_9EURO|nr:putative aflatoxin biosynthesis ketoreductase nor-1 [Aspergillus ibericus CBS 121593]RAL00702.1 putative aflatoxin biosynthesis ketoreductase nor-1 [Aspergillus ibericus CBS 121593]
MPPTIVLITGANRGIGKGILKLYLQKPNHTVIAATRDPTHPISTALTDLPTAEGTTLLIIKNESTSPTDAAAAVQELASRGISHIDIVVANAAIALGWPKVSDVTVEEIQRHVEVNVHGFIRLWQALNFIPLQSASYAPTKAIQYWFTKAISSEDPWITAFVVDPGWALTVEESATGVVTVIDASTRETHSGRPFNYDGDELSW